MVEEGSSDEQDILSHGHLRVNECLFSVFLFFCLHRCQKAPHKVRLIVPTSAEVTKKIGTVLLQQRCQFAIRRRGEIVRGAMNRRGTSSCGGASSLGYFFGSDATSLTRSNNRAPPRPRPQQPEHMNSNTEFPFGYNSRSGPPTIDDQPTGYGTLVGYQTPTGYHTPSDYLSMSNPHRSPMGHLQTRAAGKVINDGGSVSLDMSGGSMGRNNNYYLEQNSGNFITDRPSARVQAAPGGESSLGYLFGLKSRGPEHTALSSKPIKINRDVRRSHTNCRTKSTSTL